MCIRDRLEPKGSRWHLTKYIAMAGNYILMMFYTTVGGWMMLYFFKTLKGDFGGMDAEAVAGEFVSMLANPALMLSLIHIFRHQSGHVYQGKGSHHH